MSRRGPRSTTSPRDAGHAAGELPVREASRQETYQDEQDDPASRLGETLRRVSLGLLAALATARAYWPSELDPSEVSGSGLFWVLAMLAAAGLAVASTFLGGTFRFRWSWTDLAAVAYFALIGLSATRALDFRLATNLAWESAGVGLAYVLARSLPRTRGESKVLAGALVATAVAVAAYGFYQARVELPQLQARFRGDPERVLREANVPVDPQRIKVFADRLLGSNEIFSTFGLANSLAGFLVGPLVLGLAMVLASLGDRFGRKPRWGAMALALLPLLCLLACLILTKSRSAWIGLVVGASILAWEVRGQLPRRALGGSLLAGAVVIVAMTAAGLATGRLDREVLTQSTLSMRYRWEYWQGTWGVITGGADSIGQALGKPVFWSGVGPGNFAVHYLRYKLPWSSEEILDPHNLFLEVWATAGIWALLALTATLALAFRDLLGPSRTNHVEFDERPPGRDQGVSRETHSSIDKSTNEGRGERSRWLLVSAGLGLVLVFFVGKMNLFQGDLLARWLVLVLGWIAALLLGMGLWMSGPLPRGAMGAAVAAVVTNLLAAGGIGIPTVALMLWLLVALGLNLRDDRPCGRLRTVQSRIPGFGLSLAWAALAGTFFGTIMPFWRSEAALARAEDALRQPPDYQRAQDAYERAERLDRYNARPWLGDAYLQLLIWQSRGAKPDDLRWKKIPVLLLKAASPPRNPQAWVIHLERARTTRDLLRQLAPSLSPREILAMQASIVEATRTASRIYPTNALLHAQLADASAEISMFPDALAEAREALRLDGLTPHENKKLPGSLREHLEAMIPDWSKKADQFQVEVK
jgi:MFS family permease